MWIQRFWINTNIESVCACWKQTVKGCLPHLTLYFNQTTGSFKYVNAKFKYMKDNEHFWKISKKNPTILEMIEHFLNISLSFGESWKTWKSTEIIQNYKVTWKPPITSGNRNVSAYSNLLSLRTVNRSMKKRGGPFRST